MALVTTDRRKASRFNWLMMGMVLSLLAVGMINLFSALNIWGEAERMSLFWSQLVWISIGLTGMLFFAFFDYRLLEKVAVPLYIVSILLLVAVLIFGKTVAGHKSWLSIAGFAIQPSEFAKIGLIIMLTRYFSNNPRPEGVSIIELWRPIVYSMIPAMLVVMQGDLGSAIFFILIFGTYAWFGRLRGRGIAVLLIIALLGGIVLYFFGLSDYQKARITSFVDPTVDPRGTGYHLIQSRIAVGSGQLTGKGYMKGNINKLKYLPEKHTDFVFPVLAEEWGFVGSVAVLILYFLLFAAGVDVATRARDRTGLFLALGIVGFIFWHVVINLGGVLGLMPLTGVPLPFLSYGGSSTVVTMGAIGILMSIGMRRFLF